MNEVGQTGVSAKVGKAIGIVEYRQANFLDT